MGFFSDLFSRIGTSDSKTDFESQVEADLTLTAPVSGTLLPLEEVPDIVISEKVMGDGVAVVPDSGQVVSPCDGVITRVLPTKNAFSVRSDKGVEVYVSFGLESMEVHGEGFKAMKEPGARVKAGETVIDADVSLLSGALNSLITSMIVIRSSADIARVTAASGKARAGETPVVWISLGK